MKTPGRPPITPQGEHGTFSEYRRGCRCKPCAYAYSRKQVATRERIKNNAADFAVSAEIARQHLQMLSRHGVGHRAVAECLGWDARRVQDVRAGRRTRIRMSSEQLILSVGPGAGSPGSLTSILPSLLLVRRLVKRGFTKQDIVREYYGYERSGLQWIYGTKVTVATKVRMEAVYRRMTEAA